MIQEVLYFCVGKLLVGSGSFRRYIIKSDIFVTVNTLSDVTSVHVIQNATDNYVLSILYNKKR